LYRGLAAASGEGADNRAQGQARSRHSVRSGGATSATWRTDVITKFATSLGFEHLMFEAADPEVFSWYIKNYGPDVNLFIDHSQIVQVECLRSGILGHKEHMGTHPQLSVIEDRTIIMLPDIRR